MWIADLISLVATGFAFAFGLRHFFKRGKPLFLQSITMAMGCHSLGAVYQLCLILTGNGDFAGFTPAYLGRIGFFLFFIAASYGQMDRIIDDGSPNFRACRRVALLAPICAALLYIPNLYFPLSISARISALLVWLPALCSLYFHLKHALSPNCDFGFVQAIKPYNALAVGVGISELLCLIAGNSGSIGFAVLASVLFSAFSVTMMIAAKKGEEKWTV